MDKQTISIPLSYLYRGQWQAAEWSAQIVDDATGEILLTAYLPSSSDPFIQGLRLTTGDVAQLRATLPAFAAANAARDAQVEAAVEAERAYWREHLEHVRGVLVEGRTSGGDVRERTLWAENYITGQLELME